jgi:membrane protein DedA with SNARE-associated domain
MIRKGVMRLLVVCGLLVALVGSSGCIALGAAGVGAGLGAQGGWWFGKSQKEKAAKKATEGQRTSPEGESPQTSK